MDRIVAAESPIVDVGPNGTLNYRADDLGNRIPDFSHCGYAGANRDIPDVPIRAVLAPADGDDGRRIQSAIDAVAQLPLDEHGFRGAVLLMPGQFEVAGTLKITASGIVLRGSGANKNGTTVIATGTSRRSLIRLGGVNGQRSLRGSLYTVTDDYVPVGAATLNLDATGDLHVGDTVIVTRPSTAEWIKTLGMDTFGVAWKPGTRDIRWDRVVTAIDGQSVTLDAPITTAIERQYGGATVQRYDWPGRISHVGVEDICLESEHTTDRSGDEEHAWLGITMENTQDAWVRRVCFRHFAGGAVALWESTKWITVEDCIAEQPISQVGGFRRHTYFSAGQLTLFLRCWSERGRHDFSVGHAAAGPTAFVNCHAFRALADSGPIESWASGVLYDNVRIDGSGLHLSNRWSSPPGAGWSAANCVLWQCQAAAMDVFRPPTANNWAIGVWAHFAGDGTYAGRSDFVRPMSLYQGQLRDRVGKARAESIGLGLVDPIGSTNPTIAQAAEFASQSRQPARQMRDVIRARFRTGGDLSQVPVDRNTVSLAPNAADATPDAPPKDGSLRIVNGWLVANGKLVTGDIIQQRFWQGTTRPEEAAAFGPALTRFVPGRTGIGFTDDLVQVADELAANHIAVFDHHYGLWYDRRRDDHTMVRQPDGNVVPPFYEQPFARTGRGAAWDGLSKYDLTRFNPWYWQRLCDFAQLCDKRGLVLFHQNYFQHNILEAGAHWADCPWRPANNLNDTGLPEPPPYVGDKRIFLADQFYDVSDPRRRVLHRGYICQCLDNFADCTNVVQMTSAEYSGPLEFTQFWLDTIIEWQKEQRDSGQPRDVLVGISAPKNVQDAILADPERSPYVDVIDIRYWAYTAGDELYAPDGGLHLAPRQHLRQTKQKPGGAAAIVQAVREYRTRYPDKAITYYADQNCPSARDGWAVLSGGGSLPDVNVPAALAARIPTMRPTDGVVAGSGRWCLGNSAHEFVVYCETPTDSLRIDLPHNDTGYRARWIDRDTGNVSAREDVAVGGRVELRSKASVLWLEPVRSN